MGKAYRTRVVALQATVWQLAKQLAPEVAAHLRLDHRYEVVSRRAGLTSLPALDDLAYMMADGRPVSATDALHEVMYAGQLLLRLAVAHAGEEVAGGEDGALSREAA